ncbi:MAG: hypothetical protein IT374_10505 [Polyangiaceae bacterium]|nr:hypothetical protein [Polyangiaceae bacterium]
MQAHPTRLSPQSSRELAVALLELERRALTSSSLAETFERYDELWPTDEFWRASRDACPPSELLEALRRMADATPGVRRVEVLSCHELTSRGFLHGSAEFDGQLALFFAFTGASVALVRLLDGETGRVVLRRLSLLCFP